MSYRAYHTHYHYPRAYRPYRSATRSRLSAQTTAIKQAALFIHLARTLLQLTRRMTAADLTGPQEARVLRTSRELGRALQILERAHAPAQGVDARAVG